MTRPLLLEIILFVLKTGKFPINKKSSEVSAATIYGIYVQEQVKYERQKGPKREFLKPEERIAFARAMAVAMLTSGDGSLSVNYSTIIDVISEHRNIFTGRRYNMLMQHSEESIATDICVCSFLTLRFDNRFEFVHRSFFEFFLALEAEQEIVRSTERIVCGRMLSSETLYFLGGLLSEQPSLNKLFNVHLKKSGETRGFRRTIYGAIMHSGVTQEKMVFADFDFAEFSFNMKKFEKCVFRKISIANSKFGSLAFEDCDFSDCKLEKNNIDRLDIRASRGALSVAGNRTLRRVDCECSEGALDLHFTDSCSMVNFEGVCGTIESPSFGRGWRLSNCNIDLSFGSINGSFELANITSSRLYFSVPKLDAFLPPKRASLIGGIGQKFLHAYSNWDNCEIINAMILREQYDDFARRHNNNKIVLVVFDAGSDKRGSKGLKVSAEGNIISIVGDSAGLEFLSDVSKNTKKVDLHKRNLFARVGIALGVKVG